MNCAASPSVFLLSIDTVDHTECRITVCVYVASIMCRLFIEFVKLKIKIDLVQIRNKKILFSFLFRYGFSASFLMFLHYKYYLLFLQSIFSFLSSQTTVMKIDICLTQGKISQVRFTNSSTQHRIYLTSALRLTFTRYSDKNSSEI